jgi:glucose-6-phosphate isomerase
MIAYTDLDRTSAFGELLSLPTPEPAAAWLDAERVRACEMPMGGSLRFNWAASPVTETTMAALERLAREGQLVGKFRLLASGEVMNTGEKRMVLHHLTRGELAGKVIKDGRDYGAFYAGELAKIRSFAAKVHSGELKGSTGRKFETVVQIGIGGSDLGPRALYLALERWARAKGRFRMAARFISNVDPDDADSVLASVDPAASLFILVSKSGTTQETLANETLVRGRLSALGLDPSKHMIAVTSETSPLAKSPNYLASFFMDDYIGGRYSSTSAVGGAILSLALGSDTFSELLAGAHEEDLLALNEDLRSNPALLDALIGVYERNVLGLGATAVLPYAEPLSRFPAHLQQLDMESNGKRVNRFGKPVAYRTGPLVFGEPGTNGQHSFYQLLHQGTDVVPLQFIGFRKNQMSHDVASEGSTSREKLDANLAAQIVAFSCGTAGGAAGGTADADGNKDFPGCRWSTLIHGDGLDAKALGALLAHYENKVAFQGFAWNLNSFDQEGVQLGKLLAKKVLAMRDTVAPAAGPDSALAAYAALLGLRKAD